MKTDRAFAIGMAMAFVGLAVFVGVVLMKQTHDGRAAAPPRAAPVASLAPAELPQAPPRATREQWDAAVQATYRVVGPTKNTDGVREFVACFDGASGPKCTVPDAALSAKVDAFRKLSHYTGLLSGLQVYVATIFVGDAAVGAYVAQPSCSAPLVFIRPVFAGRSWLFMDRVAIMAGDEVVLEKKLENTERETGNSRVYEDAHVLLTDIEAGSLERMLGKPLIIRLSGSKGYITVSKTNTEWFQKDLPAVLRAYRALRTAAEKHPTASCG